QTEYLTQFRSILAWHAGRYFLTHLTTERRQAGAWRRRLDSQPMESWTSTTLILIYATSCAGLSSACSGPAARRTVLFAGGRRISEAACDMERLSVRVGFLSIGNASLHCFPSTKRYIQNDLNTTHLSGSDEVQRHPHGGGVDTLPSILWS
ncbi:hypothetical protein EDD16DRAFT_1555026, partial [Pisolithus croceorrhizus]